MLQWMGGSRRKVSSSRKSTQKRQKQYFEQRRRQQHQTTGSDRNADRINSYREHQKEHQSLDILNLRYLSSLAHDCKGEGSNVQDRANVEANAVKYNSTKYPSTFHINRVSPADPSQLKEAKNFLSNQLEDASTEKDLFDASNSQEIASNRIGNKEEPWKIMLGPQISVLDLLVDDGKIGTSAGSPVHEAHVAFSVEGLGKIETETPVQSPHQADSDCSPTLRAAKRIGFTKRFNHGLDDVEHGMDAILEDMDIPIINDSLDVREGHADYRHSEQTLSIMRDHLDFHGGSGSLENSSFRGTKNFYDTENNSEDLWDADSGFLDEILFDERKGHTSWQKWQCQMDDTCLRSLKYGDQLIPADYIFESPHKLSKRNAAGRDDRFNFLESVSHGLDRKHQELGNHPDSETHGLPTKHKKSGDHHDSVTSDGTRHHSIYSSCDLGDLMSRSEWSCFAKEDTKDNLSWRSEESCSSSAANNLMSNLKAKHSRKCVDDFGSTGDYYGAEDMLSKETQCNNRDGARRETLKHRSRKCVRLSSSPKSQKSHYSTSSFQENLGRDNGWLFEEKDTSLDTISDFRSFCQASKKELNSSVEDLIGSFPIPEEGISEVFSPPCSFKSEKFTFGKSSNQIHVHNSPTTSKVDFGSGKPDLTASHATPSAQEHFCEDKENISKIGPVTGTTFKMEKEQCPWNNCASSENGDSIDNVDSHNVIGLKEAVDETPEVINSFKEEVDETPEFIDSPRTSYFLSNEVESSLSLPMKIPNESESIVANENCSDITTPAYRSKETKDVQPKERKSINRDDPSYSSHHMMMLEICVLQYLRVQKVLECPSTPATLKKFKSADSF